MDRHWNTTIKRSNVFWSVESRHPIATTWSNSPSRKWRSNPVQWHHRRVQEEEGRWCLWQKEEELRKGFNISWIKAVPNNSCIFEQFKDIQEKENVFDSTLQDNVLLPKGFTEYIYHVGDASELNSIIRNGLIPGEKNLKQKEDKPFLHYSESDGGWKSHGRNSTRSNKTKNRLHTRILGDAFKIRKIGAIWSSLERKACIFYQTRSHAVVLWNTLLAACVGKAVCMKTQEELYQKVRLPSRVPRVVLRANSQYGQQDPRSQEARSSCDPSAIRRVTEKLVATSWIAEFLESLFLQSSSRTQHVRTRSWSWSRSLRTTSRRNPSFRTWARRRRSTSSVKNRRIWSPTWTTQRSSNCAKIRPNSNVLSAIFTGKSG